jgi:aquaporin Z
MVQALRHHWPEYFMEGALLGLFMISAALCTTLLEHPSSPMHQAIGNADLRRALIGVAMGMTAIALIYSPWGQRSGAHLNPATTLTFLRLGKITPWDAALYIAAQFVGGVGGVLLSKLLLGEILAHPSVNHVATVPGPAGAGIAFVAEAVLAGGMMLMVLYVTNTPKLARYTGLFAGFLVALYITFEAPLSGMSINPARTFASALPSGIWTSGWIYFSAPLLGMFLAAGLFRATNNSTRLACPKLHHGIKQRCIFCGHAGASAFALKSDENEPRPDRSASGFTPSR